ncbi:MAG: threonine/serine exporter family protein [Eubacteriales bacterium]|nr:threonine/serine exporter family protein [Eubacteriales bacterium]
MRFQKITENKKEYLDLLLLTDPQEDMIDRYLDTGDMFALYEGKELCTLAVVTLLKNRECEIRNLVTTYGHGGRGYTRAMIHFLSEYYRNECDTMYVGTWNYGESLRVYKRCGFEYSHTLQNYYVNNYHEPIYLDGEQMTDMVYLKKPLDADVDLKKVVNLALNAGRILLKNGAEIFRVDETITRICKRYHVENVDTFVLSHGIFISASKDGEDVFTKVKHVPLSSTNLEIVAEVNDLSRRITAGMINLDEAIEALDRIEQMPPKKDWQLILASGVGSGTFGYFLGASAAESVCAFFIGCVLYIWVLFAGRHKLSKILVNIVGGILITTLAVCIYVTIPIPMKIDGMIIAAILPLVPGVAFVNAIRDIADSDFLSGTVRMIDALLVFVYIAIGVGFALSVFSNWIGGLGV